MKRTAAIACLLAAMTGMAWGASQVDSVRARHDVAPETHPNSAFWRGVPAVFADSDYTGDAVPGYRMEVRSRWTPNNLYILFICPYDKLNLKPDPKTDAETNQLWKWAVAEAFIGSDFKNIRRYKEFEMSPQGEWVDLDINLDAPHHEDGWVWNSGFKVDARIDAKTKTWYGCMRIPYSSIDRRPAAAGNLLRINFYLSEGAGASHKGIEWQPTGTPSFHTPQAFGRLLLVK